MADLRARVSRVFSDVTSRLGAVLIPPPDLLRCVCFPGSTFDFDKSFVKAAARKPLRQLDAALERHPDAKLIVFGHADRVGNEGYNKSLSERRAWALWALLVKDLDVWESLFTDQREVWGRPEAVQILSALGAAENQDDGTRGEAVRILNSPDLTQREIANITRDAEARRDWFLKYFFFLKQGWTSPVTLPRESFLQQEEGKINGIMGCGEMSPDPNPASEPAEDILGELNEQAGDAPGNPKHRRAVIFLVHPQRPPVLPCRYGELDPCRAQLAQRTPGPAPRRFACAFYSRLAEQCPCQSRRFFVLVVDENLQPLVDEPYVIHQKGRRDEGLLDEKGRAFFAKVNEREPFRIEVPGRVCAIRQGAVLLTELEGVEYGGPFFDWSLADDDSKADSVFWPEYTEVWEEYETVRFGQPAGTVASPAALSVSIPKPLGNIFGPVTPWQHDHIVRRDIAIRKKYLDLFPGEGSEQLLREPKLRASTFYVVVQAVPVQIRVGPIVRFTSHDTAVIWVELETPGLIRVRFQDATGDIKHAHAATVRVGGRHFGVVPLGDLSPETQYRYTLELVAPPAIGPIPVEPENFTDKTIPPLSAAVRQNLESQLKECCFRGKTEPFFSTLRPRYDEDRQLRFAYGSCRCPAQDGLDAFPPLAAMLEGFLDAGDLDRWPRFLILCGDQIYADDIETIQRQRISDQRFAASIPGPNTPSEVIEGAWGGRYGVSRHTALAPANPMGKRYRIDNTVLWEYPNRLRADFPRDFHNHPAGERKDAEGRPIHAADFVEYAFLYEAAWAHPKGARQLMAHVPSFMMFDDHEISDDWNLNVHWVNDVLRAPPSPAGPEWRQTVADGLAAYWMYQGWGNISPSAWREHPLASILLECRADGTDALVKLREILRARAVIPPSDLPWHYELPITPRFIVIDTRSRRLFDLRQKGAPPIVDAPLIMEPKQYEFLSSRLADTGGSPVAFVVSAAPMLDPGVIGLLRDHPRFVAFLKKRVDVAVPSFDLGLRDVRLPNFGLGALLTGKVLAAFDEGLVASVLAENDIEEPLAQSVAKFWSAVQALVEKRKKDGTFPLKTIAILSGDVHFSYNLLARPLEVTNERRHRRFPEVLNMVCSALKHHPGKGEAKALEVAETLTNSGPEDMVDKDARVSGELIMGGFEGESVPILNQHCIAIVDVLFDRGAAGPDVTIVEEYFTPASTAALSHARSFIYRTAGARSEITLPKDLPIADFRRDLLPEK